MNVERRPEPEANVRARENLRAAMALREYSPRRPALALPDIGRDHVNRRVRRHLSGHTRLLVEDLVLYAEALRVDAARLAFDGPDSFADYLRSRR